MEKKNRIILFWVLTIVGFLTHSLTDALPAFWGDSIVAAMSELIDEFNAAQVFIMPMMFVLALLMAIDSIKICKE